MTRDVTRRGVLRGVSTARILARVFGNSPDSWLNIQRRTELRAATHDPKEQARIERANPLSTAAN